jgi:hypothetical protein
MLKQSIMAALLSLAMAAAYADAPVMITVKNDMKNQSFQINKEKWGYQFNNATGKTLTFTLFVAATSKNPVDLECWHGTKPIKTYVVKPGKSMKCVTTDIIKFDTSYTEDLPASGTYTVIVGAK